MRECTISTAAQECPSFSLHTYVLFPGWHAAHPATRVWVACDRVSIRLITLGPPRCFIDDKPADLPAQKLRFALLLYLAVQKRAARESVAAMFWPERDEEKARHTLSQNIYELRKLLGEDWLKAQADPLEIAETIAVDALEFEALVKIGNYEQALELYHGDFLAGFHIKGSNEFDSWIETKRRELKRLHHRAYRDHIAALLATGNITLALTEAQRWVSLDPLDDEANHTLIDVLAHNGKRAEALAHYEKYEKRLKSELDVAALDETKQLVTRIRERTNVHSGARASGTPAAQLPTYREHAVAATPASWWGRIKHSRVAKVAAVYTGSTFVVTQFADVMVPNLNLPQVIVNIVAALAVLGFPVAIGMAWIFEPDDGLGAIGDVDHHPALIYERKRLRKLGLRAVATTAFALVVSLILLYNAIAPKRLPAAEGMTLDTTLYVVLPFSHDERVADGLYEDVLIRDAMSQWEGITVFEPLQVREAVERLEGELDTRAAAEIARGLGAGRLIFGEVMPVKGGYRIQGAVYDVTGERLVPIADAHVRTTRSFEDAEERLTDFANRLILPGNLKAATPELPSGTRSIPALRAFVAGQAAIIDWDLERADSHFEAAVRFDREYVRASLWLGLVRSWARTDPAGWQSVAQRVVADSIPLNATDRTLAKALLATSQRNYPAACESYEVLTRRNPRDFVAWYGFADCLSRDHAVVADVRSASGWSFRTSYHTAANAYRRAFELLPSVHRALADGSYESVRNTLKTSSSHLRRGRALAPDTLEFVAYAGLQGDTLQFIPYPTADVAKGRAVVPWAVRERAVQHQRTLFQSIARSWASTFPESPQALQAVALALEMLEEPTAVDTLAKARRLASTDEARFRIALQEFGLRVKNAFPNNVRALKRARSLGDSILAMAAQHHLAPLQVAAVAILCGDAHTSLALARSPAAQDLMKIPQSLRSVSLPFLVLAALGTAPDSVRVMEAVVRDRIAGVDAAERLYNFQISYLRPAILAFPTVVFSDLRTAANISMTAAAQFELAQKRPAAARQHLANIERARKSFPASEIALDAAFAEATVLASIGDNAAAEMWLGAPLRSLNAAPPGVLLDPVIAASMLRGSLLLSDLALVRKDRRSAALWANGAGALLSGSEGLLKPLFNHARRNTRSTM